MTYQQEAEAWITSMLRRHNRMSENTQEIVQLTNKRSTEVLYEIYSHRDRLVDDMFGLAELLVEARRNNYHRDWGYARFGDWVEQSSGLDMKERNAYYLMNVIERSKLMGYEVEDLKKVKFSKLKEIFAVKDEEKVRQLMSGVDDMSLDQVREATRPDGVTYMNLRMTREQKDIISMAIEEIRREYGNTINEQGEAIDISEAKALEMMAADYLSGRSLVTETL